MKNINKIWIIVIIISSVVLSFCMIAKPVEAKVVKNYKVTSLRAGGGGSSGGSSSRSSSNGSRSTHTSNTNRRYGILDFLSSMLNAHFNDSNDLYRINCIIYKSITLIF